MRTLRQEIMEGRAPENGYMASLLLQAFDQILALREKRDELIGGKAFEHASYLEASSVAEKRSYEIVDLKARIDELVQALKDNNIPVPGNDEEAD